MSRSFLVRVAAVLASAVALGAFGCESAATRACSEEYGASQQRVLKVDPKSADSVRSSLDAVKSALAACRTAQRNDEVDHLVRAKNELGAQLGLLEQRAQRKPRKEPTPAELMELEKSGDSNCPKGQGYRVGNQKDIRCTGPQLVEMTAEQVKRYFDERGYRTRDVPPATLEIERGGEKYSFVYPRAGASERPSCVVLVPAQGTTWQEALGRATGNDLDKLEPKGTVTAAQGSLPYEVDEKNVVVRIGACPGPSR